MFHRKNWIAVIVVILGLVMFVPVAQAERQEFEYIACGAFTYNVVHYSPEVAIMTQDAKGIVQSTHESKLFDNNTFHSVGVIKMEGGKWSWHVISKGMGPDGDFTVSEGIGDSETGTTSWKYIYGTGKYKGIKGERKGKAITKGKPIVQGTLQQCEKHVGWIELPK